jgi:hypothetical protein
MRQAILAVVGAIFVALIYPLCSDLWRAKWLVEMNDNECEPMFLSFFIVLGVFLLMAVKKPAEHRSLIGFAAWWSIGHAAVMFIQTVQAWNRGTHRDYTDVVIAAVIGVVLLVATPGKNQAATVQDSAAVKSPV